jgi:sialic acid synthase SpsE
MSTLQEVSEAVKVIKRYNKKLILLHCVSNYPAKYRDVNLSAIITLRNKFNLIVGYSDHTPGIEIPIAAVAMGAKVIEKHFTLDKKLKGPDHKASLEPGELREMVKSIRNIESAMGDGKKKPVKSEFEVMKVARKSLIASRDLNPGYILKKEDIEIKRPGTGIQTKYFSKIIGMKVKKKIKKDELLKWEKLEK